MEKPKIGQLFNEHLNFNFFLRHNNWIFLEVKPVAAKGQGRAARILNLRARAAVF